MEQGEYNKKASQIGQPIFFAALNANAHNELYLGRRYRNSSSFSIPVAQHLVCVYLGVKGKGWGGGLTLRRDLGSDCKW